jgi:glycosyltransferase involved in cell wall biosynthesis
MLITIGIPCFNEGRNIAGLLDDVLAQRTADEIEVVVVDDCSTDDTPAIVERYRARDARVRMLRHERRRGSTPAWNTVFENARGDVLVRLDGDVRIADRGFVARLAEPLRMRAGEPDLAYCTVVPRDPPRSWVERGAAFIYRYIARQNRMGRATAESLFCAALAATRTFYAAFRIPDAIVANDYFTARYAFAKGYAVHVVDAVATIKPAATLADFRKQARRMAASRVQIDELLGSALPTRFASARAIVEEALRDPVGAACFLRLRREIRLGARAETAWEVADSTK